MCCIGSLLLTSRVELISISIHAWRLDSTSIISVITKTGDRISHHNVRMRNSDAYGNADNCNLSLSLDYTALSPLIIRLASLLITDQRREIMQASGMCLLLSFVFARLFFSFFFPYFSFAARCERYTCKRVSFNIYFYITLLFIYFLYLY